MLDKPNKMLRTSGRGSYFAGADDLTKDFGNIKTVQSVERALRILISISEADKAIGLSEISRAMGVDKSTALRLLNSLEKFGFLQKDASTRRYVLGWRISQLSQSWRTDLRTISRQSLEWLSEQTNETVALVGRRGKEAVRIDAIETKEDIGVLLRVGSTTPIYAGAGGKAILAHLSDEEIELVIEAGLRPITPSTIFEPEKLRRALKRIRVQGFATSLEEHIPGAASIAAPIFDISGRPVGAVAVSGPVSRLNKRVLATLVEPVKAAAESISRTLGYERR